MELLLFRETGLDPAHHNVIAHADFSAWVEARRTLATTKAYAMPPRTFFEVDTLDVPAITAFRMYDYAIAIDGETMVGMFLDPVFSDGVISRYTATLDKWPGLAGVRFINFLCEQSTVFTDRDGALSIPFSPSGGYTISTPMTGPCWAVAFVSDSGTFARSGVHTFIAVGPMASSYEAYATAVDLAKTTTVSVAGKVYSVDAVSGAYVIPAGLLPAVGEWGDRVISSDITTDVPGLLPYSGYFYTTGYDDGVTTPPAGIEKTISVTVGNSDYGHKRYFGNFSQLIELPERTFSAPTITTILTPAGGLSVRVILLGEEYDFSESLRVDAYYTGEDATTRAINAGSQLVASVGSVGLSAASGNPVAITGATISAGGSIARTLSEGRAYSYRGGGFRDACTVTDANAASPSTVLMPGFFLVRFSAINSADRYAELKRHGRIYPRVMNGAIDIPEGAHFAFYRGNGELFPAAGWLSDALRDGMTLWDSAGVNQV